MRDSFDFTLQNDAIKQIDNNIDRAFFILFFKWGLTPDEIAEAFGIDEEFVQKRILKTKDKIRRSLCP